MNLKKTSKALFLVAIILMFIGTFFDWQIDTFLSGKLHFYGKFFETFGLIPITIVRVICMLYVIRVIVIANNKPLEYIIKAIAGYFSIKYTATGLLTIYLMGGYWLSDAVPNLGAAVILACYLLGAIITITLGYFSFRIDRATILPLYKRVIMVFLITFIINHEVEFIKTHVGRARYYTVAAGLGNYTPWYHINGLADSNDFMSFISGHTTTAFMAFLPVFFTLPHQIKLRNKLFIFGVSFGALTAFSRMVLSQHYLTDTMGSFILSAITIFIMCKLFQVDIDGSDLT